MERAASPRLAMVVLLSVAALGGAAVATGAVPVPGPSDDGTAVSDGGSPPADGPLSSLATDEPDDEDEGENEQEGEDEEDRDEDEDERERGDDEDERDEDDEGDEGEDESEGDEDEREREDEDEDEDDDEGEQDDEREQDGDERDGGNDEDDEDGWLDWWSDDDESDSGSEATTTESPVSTPNVTITPVPTETETATPTATATNAPTQTATAAQTETATQTATPAPTATRTPTPTATQTATPAPTASPTATPTSAPTETPTQASTPTDTPTSTDTPTPSPTPTATDTPTATPRVGASTEQATATPSPEETATESFEVVGTRLSERTVAAGESVVVEVQLTNRAEQADRNLVTLRVDGELVATKGVSLDAGESDVITFERSLDSVGDHELVVAGTELPTVSVVESDALDGTAATRNQTVVPVSGELAPRSDDVEVVDANGLADWARTGYNASVEATLVNRGNRTALHTLTVAVDGRPVANETVRVPPSERANVSVEFPAAEGEVTVNGAEAGTLAVGDSWDVPTDSEPEPANAQGPGFGFGSAAVALVCGALAARALRSTRLRE